MKNDWDAAEWANLIGGGIGEDCLLTRFLFFILK
jgi:hypothetical protein